jgi:uncharacterized protein involved in exopolysaccharide biosynthesis
MLRPQIDAFDLLLAVARHKRLMVWTSLAAGVLGGLISLLLPNSYTAMARILPPQQSQSLASAMLGQLGPLGNLAGQQLGLKNPNDIYLGMLSSRTVADALIQRFDLQPRYGVKSLEKTREKLADRTNIASGKDGIISVQVEDEDPRFAADLSNAYVEELAAITRTLAVGEAAERRRFFEGQLKLAKQQLSDAEVALRSTQEATGLIDPESQGKAMIEAVAMLQAQIAVLETRLERVQTFATDQMPESAGLKQQLFVLRDRLSRLRQGGGKHRAGELVATAEVPQAGMEFVRRYRDVKYYETIFELLAKQYELAKIDEGRDSAVIQTLDAAIAPEKKSGPPRLAIALFSALGTGAVAMLASILRELPLLSPEQQGKLAAARASFTKP